MTRTADVPNTDHREPEAAPAARSRADGMEFDPGWDDPLLGCLAIAAARLGKPTSLETLRSGLPLHDHEWKHGGKPTEVFKLVRKGAPDITKGMPPWEPTLGVKRVAEVTAYVLSFHKEGDPIKLSADSPLAAGGEVKK